MQNEKQKKLTSSQSAILKRRGLVPVNYTLVKETYSSLYLRDKRNGSVKIIQKNN